MPKKKENKWGWEENESVRILLSAREREREFVVLLLERGRVEETHKKRKQRILDDVFIVKEVISCNAYSIYPVSEIHLIFLSQL